MNPAVGSSGVLAWQPSGEGYPQSCFYRGMKRCHCQKSACVGGWRFLQKRFSGSGFAATSGAPKVGSIIGTGNGHTDRRGRLIRHGKSCVTFPVCPLPVPMIEPTFGAPLVPAVGFSALLASHYQTASRAAIALPAVAVRTNPEHRLASGNVMQLFRDGSIFPFGQYVRCRSR